MVTLPDEVDPCDIGTITVWCQPFRAIFTRLAIPRRTFLIGLIITEWPKHRTTTMYRPEFEKSPFSSALSVVVVEGYVLIL